MKRCPFFILLLLVLSLLACDKTPDGVISERKMKNLLKDIYKAEALVENRAASFDSDSQKLVLKQSIFKKYGITQTDYDSSLVWYAKNIDVFNDVYKDVIKELHDESVNFNKKVTKTAPQPQQSGRALKQYHAAKGDSADLWTQPRMWMVTRAMNGNYLTFDYLPDKEMKPGDRYTLTMKLYTGGGDVQLVLAADYTDGAKTFVTRKLSHDGWTEMVIQADTGRTVSRICGYAYFNMRNNSAIAFADSIELVRTHFDAKQYGFITVQKTLSKDGTELTTASKPSTPAVASPHDSTAIQRRDGHYKPKPGVHKSGVRRRNELTPIGLMRHPPQPSRK